MIFEDRKEAGKLLAKELRSYTHAVSVLAIPRGGVPIGYEVAKTLHVPLDIVEARKIVSPSHPEYGIGAVAEGDVLLVEAYETSNVADIAVSIQQAKAELSRQLLLFRQNQPLRGYKNKIVILVDDGLATGITAKAAVAAVTQFSPKQIIFASPVCSPDAVKDLQLLVDAIVCIKMPRYFESVGKWYIDFEQVSDEDVLRLLQESKTHVQSFNDTSRILK